MQPPPRALCSPAAPTWPCSPGNRAPAAGCPRVWLCPAAPSLGGASPPSAGGLGGKRVMLSPGTRCNLGAGVLEASLPPGTLCWGGAEAPGGSLQRVPSTVPPPSPPPAWVQGVGSGSELRIGGFVPLWRNRMGARRAQKLPTPPPTTTRSPPLHAPAWGCGTWGLAPGPGRSGWVICTSGRGNSSWGWDCSEGRRRTRSARGSPARSAPSGEQPGVPPLFPPTWNTTTLPSSACR